MKGIENLSILRHHPREILTEYTSSHREGYFLRCLGEKSIRVRVCSHFAYVVIADTSLMIVDDVLSSVDPLEVAMSCISWLQAGYAQKLESKVDFETLFKV